MVSESSAWAPPPPPGPPGCGAHSGQGAGGGVAPTLLCALHPDGSFAVQASKSGGLSVNTLNCFQLRRREKGAWVGPWSRREWFRLFSPLLPGRHPWDPEWPGPWRGENSRAALGVHTPRTGPLPLPLQEERTQNRLEFVFQKHSCSSP